MTRIILAFLICVALVSWMDKKALDKCAKTQSEETCFRIFNR